MEPSEARRFAVYYAPAPGPLASFGASWLGWDLERGRDVAHPVIAGVPRAIAALTETPRRYGFHATLKPPMRLGAHATPEALMATLEVLCSETAPVTLEGLTLARLGHFVALVPQGETGALNALAARLVKSLDHFRAPAPPEELERRRKAGLSARQEALLVDWGYPYVLDEFRFHMTLSGRLDPVEAEALRSALAPSIARLVPGQIRIDAVVLVGEGADGRFRQIRRYALTGD